MDYQIRYGSGFTGDGQPPAALARTRPERRESSIIDEMILAAYADEDARYGDYGGAQGAPPYGNTVGREMVDGYAEEKK